MKRFFKRKDPFLKKNANPKIKSKRNKKSTWTASKRKNYFRCLQENIFRKKGDSQKLWNSLDKQEVNQKRLMET